MSTAAKARDTDVRFWLPARQLALAWQRVLRNFTCQTRMTLRRCRSLAFPGPNVRKGFEPRRCGVTPGRSGIGASRPLPSVPTKVRLLNRLPTLDLGNGNNSSCPEAVLRATAIVVPNGVDLSRSRHAVSPVSIPHPAPAPALADLRRMQHSPQHKGRGHDCRGEQLHQNTRR